MISPAKTGGRPRSTDMRLVVNAIFYLTRYGIAWCYMPREYPPWQTVYGYFRQWRRDGVWERMHERLRGEVPQAEGGHRLPSAAILDSQSVRTTERDGFDRGYVAGKKVSGRKRMSDHPRHILVDTLGLILLVVMHGANIRDRDGARLVLEQQNLAPSRVLTDQRG
jgi:putative transposase